MMPLKQNIPFLRTGMSPFHHAFAAFVYYHLLRGPAKGVGTCVNWVLQHARDQPRRCRDKLDRPLAGALWQLDLFLPEPKINLPGTAQLPEFLKTNLIDR